jgi:hypothetical protein
VRVRIRGERDTTRVFALFFDARSGDGVRVTGLIPRSGCGVWRSGELSHVGWPPMLALRSRPVAVTCEV